jgi:hypothetical protein
MNPMRLPTWLRIALVAGLFLLVAGNKTGTAISFLNAGESRSPLDGRIALTARAPCLVPPLSFSPPSKRLGNLAQARGTIRVESAGARCLFDHPIGRNEHGDRVGGGVILGQPGQRAMRPAA